MALEIVNLSDVGKKRPHNEDSTVSDLEHGLLVLADGMGGYKAGEVASAIAVMTVLDDVKTGLTRSRSAPKSPDTGLSPAGNLIKNSINHANSNIYSLAQTDTECHGMGTTIVTGLIHEDRISIGNVGDSRLYRLRKGKFQQLTKDHSLIQELIDRGLYSSEEAQAKMPRNLVTRALGLDAEVEVDIVEEMVEAGDIYLLCSDGLNDMVNDEEIRLTLSKYSANLVQAAENLVQLANKNGGKDNISVILARITDEPSAVARGGHFRRILKQYF